ncbi:hypothetical protein BKA80DRAFT_62991 [Phyllosticta citrichinensis]
MKAHKRTEIEMSLRPRLPLASSSDKIEQLSPDPHRLLRSVGRFHSRLFPFSLLLRLAARRIAFENLNIIDNGYRVGSQAPTWPRDLPRGTNHDLAEHIVEPLLFFSISLFHFFLRHIRLQPNQPIRKQGLVIQLSPCNPQLIGPIFSSAPLLSFPTQSGQFRRFVHHG